MTSTATTTAKPLGIGEYRDFPVPGTNLVVAVTRTADVAYTVFVVATDDGVSRRVDDHTRTFSAVEYGAGYRTEADIYRQQLLDELAPAADLISAVTAHLALAAEANKLSPAQQTAILAADADGHIVRGNGVRVDTLEALETLHLGTRTKVGYTTTGLDLNGRGRQVAEYLNANRNPIAA